MQKQTIKKAVPLALGSAMMIMTMAPAASAFAATGNPYVTGLTVSANGDNVTAHAMTSGHYIVEYEFKAETSGGQWKIVRSYQPNASFTAPSWATHVQAFAMTKYELGTKQWNMKRGSAPMAVKATSTANPITAVHEVTGGLTAKATSSVSGTHTVLYEFKVQKPGSSTWSIVGPYSTTSSFKETSTTAGTYAVQAFALTKTEYAKHEWGKKVASGVHHITVSAGAPAAVKLSPAHSSLTADGKATDTITATVVDKYGNTVTNYNGKVTIADSSAYLPSSSGSYDQTSTTVDIANGVGTVKIQAGNTAGKVQTLTSSGLTNTTGNISYGSTSVTQEVATATKLALSSSPASLTVNTENDVLSDPATVTIKTEDAAGATISSGQYVTVKLSGPGTFDSGSSVTSETLYVDGSTTVPVYGLKGQSGTVTVAASASGLASGTLNIPAYVNTSPANIKMTSAQETTSGGTPYTLYTVQLVDTNGNPITYGGNISDAISISDNSTSGTLKYYNYSSANGIGSSLGSAPISTSLTNGAFQFAVENTTVGTSNPTITVKDTTENFTATAPYMFAVGTPNKVADVSSVTTAYTKPGATESYSVQLEDANGNPLHVSGKSVAFYFNSNGAGATLPNGLSGTGTSDAYTATTNSQGVATVNVNIPSSGSTGHSFQVYASYANQTTPANGPTVTVEPSYNLATSMTLSTPSTTTLKVDGTDTVSGQTVTLDNAVNQAVSTSDQLLVTTSNPNVLGLSSYNSGSTHSDTITASSGVGALPTLTGKLAGSATVTVKDLSNPNVPSVSETFSVQPGTASQGTFYVSGQPMSSSNELSVGANSATPITLYNTDAQGNPVPVTSAEANGNSKGASFTLSDNSNGGVFRTSPQGVSTSTVYIPVGQESTTVYYVNPTAGSYDGFTATLTSNVPSSYSVSPSSATISNSGTKTVSATVLDANGNPVSGVMVNFALESGAKGSLSASSGTTNSSGVATVTYTAPSNSTSSSGTDTVTATVSGLTSSHDTSAITY